MRQAVTSIVLILGQLALVGAAPLYVCTSVDGSQRLEWGECECVDADHEHGAPGNHLPADETCPHEQHFAEPPCQCDHRPLSEGTQVVSRSEHDTRGTPLILFSASYMAQKTASTACHSARQFSRPLGHTPLVDRLSICLRC